MPIITFSPVANFGDHPLVKQPGQVFETVSLPGKLRICTGKHFYPLFSLKAPSYKK